MVAEALFEYLFRFEQRPNTAALVADAQVAYLIAGCGIVCRGRGAPASRQCQHQCEQRSNDSKQHEMSAVCDVRGHTFPLSTIMALDSLRFSEDPRCYDGRRVILIEASHPFDQLD